ncbi:MAG: hypothetical protein ABIR39_10890 [Nocardioides sp.]|uniref:hypothetical protein n=1 Tax=Nocardioides sp. TaxID=35761 RepID=UPI003263AFC8
MTRIMRLGLGIVLAAALCLAAGATSSGSAAGVARDPVVRAFVAYGDPPVSLPPGHRLRLSFTGQRGDIVHLGGALPEQTTLWSSGRRVRETWSGYYGGYYRLPADRRYTFGFHARPDDSSRNLLQLEKLRVRRLARDGRAVTSGPRRDGFIPAVSLDLQPDQRSMVTTPAYGATVLAGSTAQHVWGDPVLEVGQRLTSALGDGSGGSALTAGTAIVLTGRGTVRAVSSTIVDVTLDGALADVPVTRASGEVALRFPAASGQLVHLVGVPDPTRVSPALQGPTGSTWESATGGVWQVVETGMQTISLFPGSRAGLRVGTAVVQRIGSMRAGDPALRFTVQEPGRWLYADVDGGFVPVLTATGSTFAADSPWSASVTDPTSHNCLMPQGPLGCGEQGAATVTETAPQAESYFPLDPAGGFVILEVPPGASGSVDLQVTKRVPPYVLAR